MTTINFDSGYSVGALDGQDGWSASPSADYSVQASTVYSSPNALRRQTGTNWAGANRAITGTRSGSLSFRGRGVTTHPDPLRALQFIISQDSNTVCSIGFGGSNVIFRGISDETVGTYSVNTWYLFEIEWDYTTQKVRGRFNGGTWSSWISPSGTAWTTINKISVSSLNQEFFIDDITYASALTTTTISNIGLRTARATSEVVEDGGSSITARGFVYSLSPTPTLANNVATTTGTLGEYFIDLANLSVNTTYYIRSYFTNSLGTTYGVETSFTTNNIGQYELQKEIEVEDGETFIGQINVTGTTGTVSVKLGTTGTETIINAGSGVSSFSGTYSGTSGIIITRSSNFNGTVDNVYYTKVPLDTTVDFSSDNVIIISPIASEVFFKRIEDDVFNSYRMYRFLDLLFKDFDGYVTVTLKEEKSDGVTSKTKTFSVGNTSNPASPFSKKRISMLCKDQAIIIGLSNASLNETFAIAKFVLSGHKRPRKMFGADRIISVG